jgi:nucleoside-diphosphate-sugar epimerase
MKNILILGSSGQIGTYLTAHLRKRGYEVTEFDKELTYKHDMRIPNNTDLRDKIRSSDFVFFLAFDVGGSRYLNKYQNTFDFVSNNVAIMNNGFEYLQKTKKPFIFASSQMSNMSYSTYGMLKALGEAYTKILDGRIVKFWNVYGYETDPEKYHAITDFILKAKNTGIIDMMTDGQEERDLLYADDCCEALEMVMNRYDEFTPDTPLHITNFNWVKIAHVANIIAGKYDAKVIPSASTDLIQKNKRNEPDRFILDYWHPKTFILAGIEKVIEKMESDGR